MNVRGKKVLIVSLVAFALFVITPILLFLVNTPEPLSKTVVIRNSAQYTSHISSESFKGLGDYLYNFIQDPRQEIYYATIIDGSYTYSARSLFSEFTVAVDDSNIAWKISMQTLKTGEINGDIVVTCVSGEACLSVSAKSNPTATLQSYLPLNTNDYIISFETDNINVLSVVYYDQEGVGKSKALEKITSLGFNPEDYTINYYYGGH